MPEVEEYLLYIHSIIWKTKIPIYFKIEFDFRVPCIFFLHISWFLFIYNLTNFMLI